jgi:hypothetical protein
MSTAKTCKSLIFAVLFFWTGTIIFVLKRLERPQRELSSFQASFHRPSSHGRGGPKHKLTWTPDRHPCIWVPMYHDDQGNLLRFLIFQGDFTGQGVGNHMNGLLASHLLAEEFHRIVCVSPAFRDFGLAFDAIHPLSVKWCPMVLQDWEAHLEKRKRRALNYLRPPKEYTITFMNFLNNKQVDECAIKRKLASDTAVWFLRNNHYPRWPTSNNGTVIPRHYFEQFYKPNTDLAKLLSPSPHLLVIHLRKGDGPNDFRAGLDPESLQALGDYVQGYWKGNGLTPYLVTNHVEWYEYYEHQYGWLHPQWTGVIHSVLLTGDGPSSQDLSSPSPQDSRDLQKLWMWSDWYTLYRANTVLHTLSDFSASAIHWKDPLSHSSRVIRGYNRTTQRLELAPECWRSSAVDNSIVPPLVARSEAELRHCT